MFKYLFTPDLDMLFGLLVGVYVIPVLIKVVHDNR